MKAYKCDRCGKLFEQYKGQGTIDFYNVTRNPYHTGKCLDLCPKCNAGLQEWVANDDKEQVDCTSIDADNMKENNSDKWILISDRLPEDGTWNFFTDGKQISVERYKADAIDHFYPEGRWFSFEDAIWWMPLPKLPKAESEES